MGIYAYFILPILALLAGALLLVVFLFVFLGLASSSLTEVGMRKVPLNCPHCGSETPACDPECRACGRSFREESTVPRSVVDSPKVRRAT